MQNIPGIAIEKKTEQIPTVKIATVKKGDTQSLFADLFDQHANRVEDELAFAPASSKEKMLETAPQIDEQEQPVNAAGTKAPVKDDEEARIRDLDKRMTEEEFEEVKEDLEGYGMSDADIAEIKNKVDSEDGLTWRQFAAEVTEKMAEMHKAELSDTQKDKLGSFFNKFGFTSKESAHLITQLENGNFDKVMNTLKAKIDSMPQDKQMLFEKGEIEAFSSAMSFSKEFTTKIKELFGSNTLPKDLKAAFANIRQELTKMDTKDQQLVHAVGKVFAKSMGDKSKESSAARQLEEAVDLKTRVAEENIKTDPKENFKQVVENRKEALPDANAKKNSETGTPDKAEADTDGLDQKENADSQENWNNLFGKMSDDGSRSELNSTQSKLANTEASLLAGATEAGNKAGAKSWEKISAPKVMKQVEAALLKNLGNGTKQLTLQLTPENLGKLNIVLQVQGKEVSAIIRAESHDAAKVLAENIDIIKNALEDQGLKVEKLEVQTGLAGNQDSQDWFGQNQHNLSRDREIMVAMRNHMKNMRGESGTMAQDLQSMHEQAINADHGLHVIA
jgi:flagellar hook-length control protein FliK